MHASTWTMSKCQRGTCACRGRRAAGSESKRRCPTPCRTRTRTLLPYQHTRQKGPSAGHVRKPLKIVSGVAHMLK